MKDKGFNIIHFIIVCFIFYLTTSFNKTNTDIFESIIYKTIDSSNLVLEKYKNANTLHFFQIFYLRCQNARDLKPTNEPLYILGEDVLNSSKFLKNNFLNLNDNKTESLFFNYKEYIKIFTELVSNQVNWNANGYKIYEHDFIGLKKNKKYQDSDELLKILKNDILLNQIQLVDFTLFNSICGYRATRFLKIQPKTVVKDAQYEIELMTTQPKGLDSTNVAFILDSVLVNKEKIKDMKFDFIFRNALTSKLRIPKMGEGRYEIYGKLFVNRMNETKDTDKLNRINVEIPVFYTFTSN